MNANTTLTLANLVTGDTFTGDLDDCAHQLCLWTQDGGCPTLFGQSALLLDGKRLSARKVEALTDTSDAREFLASL